MKIFTTGGCGFIGSNFIIDQISNHKSTVFNFDKLTYAGNLNNLASIDNSSNYTFFKGDICDYELLGKRIFDFNPDFIVHFAAESHVDRSIDNPLEFINTNIVGTANLLEISVNYHKTNKYFCFLHVSTDEVYGSLGPKGLFSEDSPYNPNSPYSASKASSDFLVKSWSNTYKLPTILTNCSNNYGPFQFPEKLIPLLIHNCLAERSLPVYGDGSNIRDWLYVKDHCRALDLVFRKGQTGECYNIGGSNEWRNLDVVHLICDLLDKELGRSGDASCRKLITFVKDRPGHDQRYAIDPRKMRRELKWSPELDFQAGLLQTIHWYLNNQAWVEQVTSGSYREYYRQQYNV